MDISEMKQMVSGRKVDNGETDSFGGRVFMPGGTPKTEEIGSMRGLTGTKSIDWTATMRAWGKTPEPITLEERIAALERQAP